MFWQKRSQKAKPVKGEADSPSNLGNILIGMNAITEEDLQAVLLKQAVMTRTALENLLLGKLLVDGGYISDEQLFEAIDRQRQLRSKNKFQKSMAIADHAIKRHRRGSIVMKREAVVKKGKETVKKITGKGHPAVTPDMFK